MQRPDFRLYLITDRKLAARHGGLPAVVEAALRAASTTARPGAVAVQLREKDLDARELYELACALRERCSRWRAPLLVNDRLDVAIAAGADGVHLPANSFAVADARRLMGPAALIGVSTHQVNEVAAAQAAGANFAVFGPVYDPLSKPVYGAAGGADQLGAACRAVAGLPLYALGGITAERIGELGRSLLAIDRPAGVAVIGAVFGADDPGRATVELLQTLATWR
ncbi:MAG TPA: thiamine phosphate synthase [Candidatus Binataceae bacterium]|nr:thiamine phosphate synthase [Candidatus Binataceae bacterium]